MPIDSTQPRPPSSARSQTSARDAQLNLPCHGMICESCYRCTVPRLWNPRGRGRRKSSGKAFNADWRKLAMHITSRFTRFTSPPLLPASYLHASPKYPPNTATSLPSIFRALQCFSKIRCPLDWAAVGPYKRSCPPARSLVINQPFVIAISEHSGLLLNMLKIRLAWRELGILVLDSGMVIWLPRKAIASVSRAGQLLKAATSTQ